MMKDVARHSQRESLLHLIIGIMVFGSIWGFFEATLGGFLHMVAFPNKGAIMSGIGVAIMASALSIYKKPAMMPGIGVVAASFRLLDAWLFSLPITSIHITNPATAIIFESLAFGAVAAVLMSKIATNVPTGIGAGVLAGLLSATAWVYFAIYVLHANLAGRVITTAGAFIANQGVIQAAFASIFLPLGYLAGEKLGEKIGSAFSSRRLRYATSAAVIVFCWAIGIIATTAGL